LIGAVKALEAVAAACLQTGRRPSGSQCMNANAALNPSL